MRKCLHVLKTRAVYVEVTRHVSSHEFHFISKFQSFIYKMICLKTPRVLQSRKQFLKIIGESRGMSMEVFIILFIFIFRKFSLKIVLI